MVKRELERIFIAKDLFELFIDANMYYIDVKNLVYYHQLLVGGPIFSADRILLVRKWSSAFEA